MSRRLLLGIAGACVLAIVAGVMIYGTHRHIGKSTTQSSSTTPQIVYSEYVNARFAYSVCYPPQILVPQGESSNGDGQKFISKDGQAVALVYGANNALGQSLQQVFNQDAEGVTLNDRSMGTDKFTFSGKTSDDIMEMEKTFFRNQGFKTLNIQFPATRASTYVPIAEHMIECFATTTPTQYSQ